MSLTSGSRIGPYEIGAAIGAGGMGEVYRATDTRLKRDVAIKVLPAALASDAERLARFQREAEVLAALNHPHIAAIYGLEDNGGVTALVMELVDGDDLSRLIPQGGIPVTEALVIAKQIAEALEAAHEQGIIHRDLKPANVKVRPDGTVKVLDFGLAKAMDQGSGIGDQGSGDLVNSPTITSPAMTMRGVILGTAAYMSPEQARGRVVDKRTDIWAFGAVLYEMLTGKRAFEGEDVSMTLASVMKSDPDFSALPADLPPAICACLARCLHKDPRQRLRDIGDVRLILEGAFDEAHAAASVSTATVTRAPLWRRMTAPAVSAAVAVLLMGAGGWTLRPRDVRPVTRFEFGLPQDRGFRGGNRPLVSLSPDGRFMVYNGSDGIYVHTFDDGSDRRLVTGAANTASPVVAPDSDAVVYAENSQLRRIALSGGAPVKIADVSNPWGIRWTHTGAILFATTQGIFRVSANGGEPELLVPAASGELLSGPDLLPDGKTVIFTRNEQGSGVGGRLADSAVLAQPITGGTRSILVPGGANVTYHPEGYLVYTLNGSLFAAAFDARTASVTGGPVSLVERLRVGVAANGIGMASYSIAANGTLAYVTGVGHDDLPLMWVNRDGTAAAITTIAKGSHASPRLSADNTRVLVVEQADARIYELSSGREHRVTTDRSVGAYVAWMPGDRAVGYSSIRPTRGGGMNLWRQSLDRAGPPEQMTDLPTNAHLDAWAPDGKTLVVHIHERETSRYRIFTVPAATPPTEPKALSADPGTEEGGTFSPDGRYVAYAYAIGGNPEVVVRPFPGPGPITPISVGGGREPVWARNGELFYRRTTDDAMMSVRMRTSPVLEAGAPVLLFNGPGNPGGSSRANFDVTSDGQRFIMSGARVTSRTTSNRDRISVVLNWVEELKQRVPRD